MSLNDSDRDWVVAVRAKLVFVVKDSERSRASATEGGEEAFCCLNRWGNLGKLLYLSSI